MGAGGEEVGSFTSNTFAGDKRVGFTSRMSISLKVIEEHTERNDGATSEHVSDGRRTGIRTMRYCYHGTWLRASVRTSSRLEEELR